MFKKVFITTTALLLFTVFKTNAQPCWIDCYGGIDSTYNYWSLLDHLGYPLEDGDWVYAAWVGQDGEIDPPDLIGQTSGDDVILQETVLNTALFFMIVTTWEQMAGLLIYCRMFDDAKEDIGPATYYAESQLHEIEYAVGEEFFCLFPGDPGGGHTDTPLFNGPLNDFTVYGGVDTTGLTSWPLMDINGQQLEDGDVVQLIIAGPNELIDPVDAETGLPSGDDSLLAVWGVGHGYEQAGTGLFLYETYAFESDPWEGYPSQGNHLFVRVFDDSTIGEDSRSRWYGESLPYEVIFAADEKFYSFPDIDFDATIQTPWYRSIMIYGGLDSSMAEHPLTDSSGSMLEDGDLVQLIWAGPNGSVDAINEINGMPAGDDSLLTSLAIGLGYGDGTGLFKIELQTFSSHVWGMPADGDALYIRVFNNYIIKYASHYGESDVHIVRFEHNELFFPFPDDANDCVIPISIPTSVEWDDKSSRRPIEFALLQNYPNPFNANTEIKYAIPVDAHISIKVYNVHGDRVATLFDGYRKVGFYTLRWDPNELASGVYFCRLRAGNFNKTVKMVLLR